MLTEKQVLVFGGKGQLGMALGEMSKNIPNLKVTCLGHEDCDITNEDSVDQIFERLRPDWVINSAAWTNTKTVKDSAEGKMCWEINAKAPVTLAKHIKKYGARMFHISTDYVFNPDGVHLESKPVVVGHQANWYGETKAMGEVGLLEFGLDDSIHIARVSATFGPSRTDSNFVIKVLRNAIVKKKSKDLSPLRAVADELTRPTSTWYVARQLLSLVGQDNLDKIYHLVSGGVATRYEQMRFVLDKTGFELEIQPFYSSLRVSVLENSLLPLAPSWEDQTLEVLAHIMQDLT